MLCAERPVQWQRLLLFSATVLTAVSDRRHGDGWRCGRRAAAERRGAWCIHREAFTKNTVCDLGLDVRPGGSRVEREVRVQVGYKEHVETLLA